jgi:hypothetical protein
LRNLLVDPLMWSRPVEILDVETQDTMELLLTEDQYVIQALSPHTQEKAFTNRIGSWRVIRRFQYLNTARCCHASETGSKLAIMIADELLRRMSIRSGLPQLLSGPRVGRRARHPTWTTFRDRSSMMKKANTERKNRSVTWRKSQAQISPP